MKNLHISMAFIFVLLLITASCSDKDDSAPRVIPTMNPDSFGDCGQYGSDYFRAANRNYVRSESH